MEINAYPFRDPRTALYRPTDVRSGGRCGILSRIPALDCRRADQEPGDRGDHKIDTEYLDGPFKYMRSNWHFEDVPQGGCKVFFFVDFEFRNIVLQKIIGVVFNEAMQRVVKAFEKRAQALYGPQM